MIRRVQHELTSSHALSKSDRSPVTVADFLSQAVVCRMIHRRFPTVPIVAEEDSSVLQSEESTSIVEKILEFTRSDETIRDLIDESNLFECIDLGTENPADVFWTLDPIDGTKGFLRGEQFAVALALIAEGKVKLGILGCPRLTISNGPHGEGLLFWAVNGEGACVSDMDDGSPRPIAVSQALDPAEMRFVQSYVSAHGNLDLQNQIAEILGIRGRPVQLDSQVKYGLVSSGNAEIYLRIPNPKSPNYREKIWDHAAGSIIVEEAGGVVSDIHGNDLDFSKGKMLEFNSGVLATLPGIQPRILNTIGTLMGKG
jgi:3'(2'), 5'-bisphosphate nucleotidase